MTARDTGRRGSKSDDIVANDDGGFSISEHAVRELRAMVREADRRGITREALAAQLTRIFEEEFEDHVPASAFEKPGVRDGLRDFTQWLIDMAFDANAH